jgi:two-component system, cell cycle sensor histidine kinase and response regulator CckA
MAAEARLHLLSQILRLAQDLSHSVGGESEGERLLQGVCALLTETRGYRSAWIAPNLQVDGDVVDCAQREPEASGGDPARLTVGLCCNGARYGALVVVPPASLVADPEEQSLLGDIAALVGFALHHVAVSKQRDEATEELRMAEARVGYALERCHIGVWEIDLIDLAARRTLEHDRIFGYDSLLPEWTSETFLQHVVPEDRPEVKRRFDESAAGRTDSSIECRIRRPDGEIRWIGISGSHMADETGQPRRMIGIVQDITNRVKAETALRKSEQRLATIFNASPLAICTSRVADGKLVDANEAFLRLFGYEREEAIGHTTLALNMWKDLENRSKVIQALATHGSISNAEFAFRKKSGETGTSLFSAGLIEVEGEHCMLAMINDITEQQRTREALQESEERFLLAFRASPVPQAITTNDEGVMLEVNETFCTMMGYERDELLGRTTIELGLYPDPAVRQSLSEIYQRDGRLRDCEVNLRTRGGEKRKMLGSCEGLEWKGIACGLSAFRDITEEERKERAVADALETTRAIVDNAPFGVLIFKATGLCVTANGAAGRMLGATPSELVGLDFYEIEAWKPSGLLDAAREAISSGLTISNEHEITTTFGVHLWTKTVFTTFESGGELHLMMMFDDITESKMADQAIRQSEERFRTLFDAAPDGIHLQSERRFRYVNPALVQLLGATGPEELLGTDLLDRVAPEFREVVSARIDSLSETKVPTPPLEIEYLRLDGARVAVETRAVGFPALGGNAHLVFVRDRTERVTAEADRSELQEQLLQSQKMESVGQLAGGVAHDFNNILMVQKGYCEILRQGLKMDDPLAAGLSQIELYADRATALTRQLLAFSRKQTLQPTVMDLNSLVDDMEDMLRRLIGEDVELVTNLAPHPAVVKADRSQIEQVLVNLAVNSRDAMPRGGKLAIELSWADVADGAAERKSGMPAGQYVLLAVSDSGCGMDAETQRRAFEPFFTTKAEGKGTGLGLSTVYGIIRQSGGNIRVQSKPGKGTVFSIWLPRIEDDLAAPAERRGGAAQGDGQHVLIVEDEGGLRGLVVMMMEKLGYRVDEAANGGEALMLVEEKGLRPDLLLTDVVMPGMTGVALVERLRRVMPHLKVIYMSGYTDEDVLGRGVKDPGVDFLRKPFSMSDLATQAAALLNAL